MKHKLVAVALAGVILGQVPCALANGFGEDAPWQFQTSADMANLAAVQSLIQQKKNGMFHAPLYNSYSTTNIDKQFNCGVSATAYGNWATSGQSANSPTTYGANGTALGNSSASTTQQYGPTAGPINLTSAQSNTGAVSTGIVASGTNVQNGGPVGQSLNSTQTNSGTQTATVANSTACSTFRTNKLAPERTTFSCKLNPLPQVVVWRSFRGRWPGWPCSL